MNWLRLSVFLPLLLSVLLACRQDKVYEEYITENVIIVVMDGARYSETWGEPYLSFIPNESLLRDEGVYLTNYRNEGWTFTVPGHAAMITGKYENLDNSGMDIPTEPSLFQVFRKEKNIPQDKVWLVCSKGKLDVLSNCTRSDWKNKYRPSSNCGIDGGGIYSGYRHDSLTFNVCMDVLNTHHPRLMLVNFREPDYSGHHNDFPAYLKGIKSVDGYVEEFWNFIQNDPVYKNKTTLIITNDHGRHLDGIADGFAGHGDGCEDADTLHFLSSAPTRKRTV